MALTATAHRLLLAQPGSGALLRAAVATAAFGATLAQLRHGGIIPTGPDTGGLDPVAVTLAAGATAPLLASARFPLGGFVVTAAASVVLAGLGYPVDLLLGPAAALYLLAADRPSGTPWTARTTATVAGLFAAYLVATAAAGTAPWLALLHTGMAWAVAWFAGERTRLRREHLADLEQRAVRTERDADRERRLAVAEERARIARDLHDSAGQAISVIAVRAGAARLRHAQDPDRSLQALAAIETQARQTVAEIDQLVGTLREPGRPTGTADTPVGLASLGTLVAHHTAGGLAVTVHTVGTPRPLTGAADQAAYRILQEALRNAARHGTGRARIELGYGEAAVELTVTNPVTDGREEAPRTGGGHGLIGMRERATLLDGSLDAGRVDGVYRVHARIPYRVHP